MLQKIVQIALSESMEDGESSVTFIALSNHGRIFKGGLSWDPYKGKPGVKWFELPCPIGQFDRCQHGPLPEVIEGAWSVCLFCQGSVPSDADDLDGSQPI